MKSFHLSIGNRLGLGFGFILLLLGLLAAASLSRLASMHEDLQKIVHDNNRKIRELNAMRQAVMTAAIATRNLSVMTNDDDIAAEIRQIDGASVSYRASVDRLAALAQSDEARKLLAGIDAAEKKSAPLVAKAVNLARKQADVMPVLLNEVSPSQQAWLAAMDKLIAHQEQQARKTAEDAATGYHAARNLVVLLAAAALLLGSAIALTVTRGITTPLRHAVTVARRVSSGDLSEEIPVTSHDETGQLMAALRDMNAGLEKIVLKVRHGTDAMLAAAGEIASGNLDLSSRTEEQADSLSATVRSMEQLTSTVRHNADSAQEARTLALRASDIATQGGAVVAQVVGTMASIQASAKRIVDIIGVIDGIAFQTNILALNAAVEASRAGEQGRGFAVVAAEVQALARRSAEAAREIKTLIGNSAQQVGIGAEQVDRTGATMQAVVGSIRSVTDMIEAIASASTRQTLDIEQIRAAIADMDDVTHRNAALVEQAAAAAGSMEQEAGHLSEAVRVFKLHETHSGT